MRNNFLGPLYLKLYVNHCKKTKDDETAVEIRVNTYLILKKSHLKYNIWYAITCASLEITILSYFHKSSSSQLVGNPISLDCAKGHSFINPLSWVLKLFSGLIIFKTYSTQDKVA